MDNMIDLIKHLSKVRNYISNYLFKCRVCNKVDEKYSVLAFHRDFLDNLISELKLKYFLGDEK